VAVQEDHDLTHHLLTLPSSDDLGLAPRADPVDFQEPVRRFLDDLEHLGLEGARQPTGESWANPFDHAAGKILFHPLGGVRRNRMELDRSELAAVFLVNDLAALGIQSLPCGYFRQRPQDGHQISLAADLDLQNRKAGFRVVEDNPLDETGRMITPHPWVSHAH
jgi:hypothetical protein